MGVWVWRKPCGCAVVALAGTEAASSEEAWHWLRYGGIAHWGGSAGLTLRQEPDASGLVECPHREET